MIMMASAAHVDAMVSALDGHGGRLVRHHLSAEDAKALEDAVAGDPTAARHPATECASSSTSSG